MGYYEDLVKGMSDEDLDALLASKPPWKGYRYKPQFTHITGEKTMGEKFLESIEEEGDIEEVTKKFLNKMKRQAGATKEASRAYLERELKKAQEEGRI
jgi:hypothetical protein